LIDERSHCGCRRCRCSFVSAPALAAALLLLLPPPPPLFVVVVVVGAAAALLLPPVPTRCSYDFCIEIIILGLLSYAAWATFSSYRFTRGLAKAPPHVVRALCWNSVAARGTTAVLAIFHHLCTHERTRTHTNAHVYVRTCVRAYHECAVRLRISRCSAIAGVNYSSYF
jgi:hypothetical protein